MIFIRQKIKIFIKIALLCYTLDLLACFDINIFYKKDVLLISTENNLNKNKEKQTQLFIELEDLHNNISNMKNEYKLEVIKHNEEVESFNIWQKKSWNIINKFQIANQDDISFPNSTYSREIKRKYFYMVKVHNEELAQRDNNIYDFKKNLDLIKKNINRSIIKYNKLLKKIEFFDSKINILYKKYEKLREEIRELNLSKEEVL